MGNREKSPDFYSELKIGLSYSGGEITIEDTQAILAFNRGLCPIVTELVNNCLDKGATQVTVVVEWGRITVEDDIAHT
jgi:hypothetical protein